jgi:antirestriction protein ArdC
MANVYNYVTDKIIEELQKGNIPWQKNWKGQKAINYVTRKEYHGINTLLLPFPGEYLTFKQCTELNGKVKKGEKSHMIVFYKWIKEKDQDGNINEYPLLNYYNVFHISQCEGIDSKCEEFKPENENNIIQEAENIINNYVLREGIKYNIMIGSDRAYYQPSTDEVVLPDMKQFDTAESFYATAFHELTHSTGNEKRLKRIDNMKSHKFGSKDYSKEELIAEIGSAYLNNQIGIDNTAVFKNSVAYIQSWLKALKDDVKLITIAAGAAQKAVNYINNIKYEESAE